MSSVAAGAVRPAQAHPVHFFIVPSGVPLERLRELDPERDWTDMRRGRERWIVPAYSRLRRLGHPVTLGGDVPASGFVVYHKEDHRELLRRYPAGARPWLVACRADFRSADEADFELLQNGHYADGRRCFFMPYWPQPGLVPRDRARGERVETIAFKGYIGNLLPELRQESFTDFLTRHGMTFQLDALADRDVSRPVSVAWHDYSGVDVVLALRPAGDREHTHKPATKLYNAWLAGVPAILSPDDAFRELRRDPLDYLEVTSVAEAQQALLRLRDDPGLYRAMVENGRVRGREFTADALAVRWQTLLYETLPPLAAARPRWQSSRFGRALVGSARKLRRALRGGSRR